MLVTIISMYRAYDAEQFTFAVRGTLTDEQKDAWAKEHKCDEHHEGEEDEVNNMCFRTLELGESVAPVDLVNIDGSADNRLAEDPSVSKQETGACGEDCTVPVDPATLSVEALVGIARYAQSALFLALVPNGPHRVVDVWTLDKDVSGADFIEQMTRELNKHGLAPEAGSLS